ANDRASRGLGSAAVVHVRSPVGQGYAESFEAATARAGVELLGRSAISPLAEDASAVVDRLRVAKPEALVYLGLGAAARPVSLALEQAGWRVPVVANSARMVGYARQAWRAGWQGGSYLGTVADRDRGRP